MKSTEVFMFLMFFFVHSYEEPASAVEQILDQAFII